MAKQSEKDDKAKASPETEHPAAGPAEGEPRAAGTRGRAPRGGGAGASDGASGTKAAAGEAGGGTATRPAGKPKAQASKQGAGRAAEETPRKKRRGRPMRGQSRKQKAALEHRPAEPMPVGPAVAALRKVGSPRKFDQTVNIVMHLGIDPKQADQMIRGAVALPMGIGKARSVICFAEGDDAEAAKAAGAVEVGADDLVAKINGGWSDFDVAVAHPRLMARVGKLGRVLGPLGKMPSPKNGTVTPDVATAVREFAAGKVEFRNDAGGNVHGIVGKWSFSDADLQSNIEAFIEHIRRMRPQSAKGEFIRKVCISGTMTPSIEVQTAP